MNGPPKEMPQFDRLLEAVHSASAASGRWHVQSCSDCGALRHPPRYYCGECRSPRWELVESAQRGVVVAAVTTYRSPDPNWNGAVPFSTLIIDLGKDVKVLAAERGRPMLNAGDSVRLVVETLDEHHVHLWAESDAS